MLVHPPSRPLPHGSATPIAGPALRYMLCLIAFCIGLQGIALSAQRAAGRALHHLGAELAAGLASIGKAAGVPASLFVHSYDLARKTLRDHDHPPDRAQPASKAHGHARLAQHEHDAGDATVVYAEEDHGTASPVQVPAPTRGVHDLDGLTPRPETARDTGVPDRWWAFAAPIIRSHITPALERPPQG